MSWSVGVSAQDREYVFDALDEVFGVNYSEPNGGVKDQFEQAKDCVDSLLSIIRGDKLNVSLSGHAQQFSEEGNAVDSPDSINISLSVVNS